MEQVEQVTQPQAPDPLAAWWAGKKQPKSQLTEQLEGSLLITESDIPKSGKEAPVSEHQPAQPQPAAKPARKRRSDAGVTKGPKLVETAAAPAGAISKDQKERLLIAVALVQQTTRAVMEAEIVLENARRMMDQAQKDLSEYLDSLSLSGLKS